MKYCGENGMTTDADIRVICAQASDLYSRADALDQSRSIIAADAAKALRNQARLMLCDVERELRLRKRDALAGAKLDYFRRSAAGIARDVKYRVDIITEMRRSGELAKTAKQLGMPVETLELYLAKELERKFTKAVIARDALVRKGKARTRRVEEKGQRLVARYLEQGWPRRKIEEATGESPAAVLYVTMTLTETQIVARKIAIAARRYRRARKAITLRQEGLRWVEIASRTGLTQGYCQAIWQRYEKGGYPHLVPPAGWVTDRCEDPAA